MASVEVEGVEEEGVEEEREGLTRSGEEVIWFWTARETAQLPRQER